MFALFALRRPDILPVGDLGVQKGLVRWTLARHAPEHAFTLRPDAVEQDAEEAPADPTPGPRTRSRASTPVPAPAEETGDALAQAPPRGSSPDASSVPPASAADTPAPRRSTRTSPLKTPQREGLPALPTPFTASIRRVLAGADAGGEDDELPSLAPALPDGLTVPGLKARLDGKKKIKCVLCGGGWVDVADREHRGAILTPAEMEALTKTWRP
jgi:DNA-3-methyladenine glycosylase II